MNEEIRWLVNDRKVDNLRERMAQAREEFRKKCPNSNQESEDRHLSKKFRIETGTLLKEQMGIVKSAVRSF